jgi:hypothetical protein
MPGFSSSGLLQQPMVETGLEECLQEIEVENGCLVLFINLALPIGPIR